MRFKFQLTTKGQYKLSKGVVTEPKQSKFCLAGVPNIFYAPEIPDHFINTTPSPPPKKNKKKSTAEIPLL